MHRLAVGLRALVADVVSVPDGPVQSVSAGPYDCSVTRVGQTCWLSLHCRRCGALVAEQQGSATALLAGLIRVRSAAAGEDVSVAWGSGTGSRAPVVVLGRGGRSAVVAPGHLLEGRVWIAACPGSSRTAFALSEGRSSRVHGAAVAAAPCPVPRP